MEECKEEFIIHNSNGKPMLCDIRFPKQYGSFTEKMPIIIFSHGFKGFKDFGCFNLIASEIAKNGYVFLKFNFSMNGTTPDYPNTFVDLDAFAENTFSQELNDLGDVIDYVHTSIFREKFPVDINQIYLMGHSMGGGVSILKANEDDRIKKIITLASIFEFGKFWNTEMINKWEKEGIRYEFNSRTKQDMPLEYIIYQDFIKHFDRLNIPNAVKNMLIPFCLIHGEKDETVPVLVVDAFKKANQNIDIHLIKDTNHTFGMTQPWNENILPIACRELVAKILVFIAPD